MMTCAELRPLLSFFLEKETGPLETLEARRHLDACPRCRARARTMAGVLQSCSDLPAGPPGRDLPGAVMQRLRALKAASGARGAKWTGLALLLAGGLGALAAPDAPMRRALGRPLSFLAGLVSQGGASERLRELMAESAPGVPQLVQGGIRAGLSDAALGMDATLAVNLLATALAFVLALAIPVALVTAWLLHRDASRSTPLP
ncbi:MAG TPA: zf-HC2 domain-containing protein [Candidatus Polarisedimenticolia bacterium]|nr:zf-HC2 domain-containing protein [Candidatus Polarisedimenticolia bacterium]